ncbi:MAG: hypothetical protein UX65_C0004G0048 [Parcubacteria group bacterium GW2011_GWB1_46_8]|nr:MAG: hypothetical protein UX14_C0002G0016 [Parcubacteria group bacterium GW2011_GWF1_45_5]KKU11250.1 MAG: hypothetical protein UX15_C0012G0007 [Parcubacteria group bacterium GW2011_GWA1_45_7]KKU46402.1 MAG: hypothetical protein UX65_C0004G0048 [Parcubacteria group bacterium GW2011_GWB1_46_8]HCS79154.1 hypothetical protein [Patescibacteria group bacterium]
MRIFYTCSYYGKNRYQKYYDLVLRAIQQICVEVISPELGNYLSLLSKQEIAQLGDQNKVHREAIRRGIEWADAVIIEISHEDFQLGHEATIAVQSKKHVLCVSVHENIDNKINLRYFHGTMYNEQNIEGIVAKFVETAQKSLLSERFNLFLSPSQVRYLRESSRKYGLNQSEYLRKLIDQDKIGA